MAKVSQITNGGNFWTKELKTNSAVSTIEPGLLVALDTSGSSVSLAAATGTPPLGIAYGNRPGIYTPTSRVFGADEPLVVVWGDGEIMLSLDFFTEGSVPAAPYPQKLYAGANGKFTLTAGSFVVGDVIGKRTRTAQESGLGAAQDLAIVRFRLVP